MILKFHLLNNLRIKLENGSYKLLQINFVSPHFNLGAREHGTIR